MIESLVIIGTGGSAYDVLDIVEAINAISPRWEVIGFLDDSRPAGTEFAGRPILGRIESASGLDNCKLINVVGSDRSYRLRRSIISRTGLAPDRFVTLIHPGATVSRRAMLGRGVYVNHGVSIAGAVTIGDHVQFGPNAVIGHDAIIDDFTVVGPAAVVSGFVRLGVGCYIGAGAMIRQHQRIGDGALVGIGAVVVNDVPPDTTVVGNPARALSRGAAVRQRDAKCS